MHRYAPTSPSAFNHKKKPLLPGCDRHPSRSLARGAQQQPSPPHSGRGHSTAYTHRHFPLPSLVQDCSDDPLALAQAPNPHMPQYVSLRLWLPDNVPSLCARRRSGPDADPHLTAFPQDTLLRTLPDATAWRSPAIARTLLPGTGPRKLYYLRFPKRGSPRTANPDSPCRALHTHSPKTPTRSSPERRPQHQISKSPHCSLFSNSALDRPSCSSQNTSLFSLREYLSWRYKISQQHRGPRRHFPFVNSNRTSYLRFPQQRRALCISSASHS